MGLGGYILWSTLLVVMNDHDVSVHQTVSSPAFANKVSCEAAMETLVKGRTGKQVEREDGYIRTIVEIQNATMVNRLQCLPLDIQPAE